jgi:hypothetical protein
MELDKLFELKLPENLSLTKRLAYILSRLRDKVAA